MELPKSRSVDDRLFPSLAWDTGWSLSLQADYAGYQCSPQKRLDRIEDYTSVEAVIYGPFAGNVDVTTLNLPEHVLAKFTKEDGSNPAIGCHLSQSDIQEIIETLNKASLNPNAGIPRGSVSWPGAEVWHGTDLESAKDIVHFGVRLEACGVGYFGKGFYTTDDRSIAVENYGDFSADDTQPGAIVKLRLEPRGRILDLRNAQDYEEWKKIEGSVADPNFHRIAAKHGISAVYDRSFCGLVIYDPKSIVAVDFQVLEQDVSPSP